MSVVCKKRCVAATRGGDVVISIRLILLGDGLHAVFGIIISTNKNASL